MSEHGILIVFDGIDGAGKTTQVHLLADALRNAGEDVIISKEPTNGQWGSLLRASALEGRLAPATELDYFLKDRQEHLATKIRPALKEGKVVILDRYFYSTIAYQGIHSSNLDDLVSKVKQDVEIPDVTFIIDIDPNIATTRISARDGQPNQFERIEDLEKIDKVFKKITPTFTEIVTINGHNEISIVQKAILENLVENVLKQKRCTKQYGCDDALFCTPRMLNLCTWFNVSRKLRSIFAKV